MLIFINYRVLYIYAIAQFLIRGSSVCTTDVSVRLLVVFWDFCAGEDFGEVAKWLHLGFTMLIVDEVKKQDFYD